MMKKKIASLVLVLALAGSVLAQPANFISTQSISTGFGVPFYVDQLPDGSAFRIGSVTFDSLAGGGYGFHATGLTRIAWIIAQAPVQTFKAKVGTFWDLLKPNLDDVRLLIYETGDPNNVFFDQNLVKGAEPVPLSIDVSGVTSIDLVGEVVGFPDFDLVSFGNPRVVLADTTEINLRQTVGNSLPSQCNHVPSPPNTIQAELLESGFGQGFGVNMDIGGGTINIGSQQFNCGIAYHANGRIRVTGLAAMSTFMAQVGTFQNAGVPNADDVNLQIVETGNEANVLYNQDLVKGAEPIAVALDVSTISGFDLIATVVGFPDFDRVYLADAKVVMADTSEAFLDDTVLFCEFPPTVDIDGNCVVDMVDFSAIAREWLDCGLSLQSSCP